MRSYWESRKLKQLTVATSNKGKIAEIRKLLEDSPYIIVSMEQAGIVEEIEETGSTFEENSLLKANAVRKITGGAVLADDSGLEVDYLKGAPGIYSSRFAGPDATDEEKVEKLLDLMKSVPFEKRTARFVCAATVITGLGSIFTVREVCGGYIADSPRGENGFGYDPVFYLPEFGQTMAEIGSDLKNEISHRGKALKQVKKLLLHIDDK